MRSAAIPCLALVLATAGMTVPHAVLANGTDTGVSRPRIGLVLGGGGAKGAAHVGVLSVLDELRIPVDCIAGTSMGALVGGTFAAGSSAADLEAQVRAISWQDTIAFRGQRQDEPMRRKLTDATYSNSLEFGVDGTRLTPPTGLIPTQRIDATIDQLVARSRGITDFDDLPIPFRAVATDMLKGEMVVLSQGDLARSMRASMSVPGVFAPVKLEGRLLGDGGLTRNLPVDVVRQTCADVVIAVSVPNPPPTEEQLRSPITQAAMTLDILIGANERQQIATLGPADVLISVPVGEIGSASFDRVGDAIPLGRATALAKRSELGRYSMPEAEYLAWRASVSRPQAAPVRLAAVRLDGLDRVNPEYVRHTLRLAPGDEVTEARIAKRVNDVFALGDFETVRYTLEGDPSAPTLVVEATESLRGRNTVRFDLGLHLGTDTNSAFLVGADYLRTWVNSRGGQFRATAMVGRTDALSMSFYQPIDLAQTWFVEPGAVGQSSLQDIYIEGDAVAGYDFNAAFGYFDLGRVFGNRAELRAGLRAGGQSVKRDIALPTLDEVDWEGYGGVAVQFTYDTRDSVALPRSGLLGRAVYFDSADWLGAAEAYRRGEAMLSYALPVGTNVAYLRAAGGSSFATELPVYDDFLLGGPLSFPGFAIGELRGQGYWVTSAAYLHRVADISDLFGLALYAGGMATAGAMNRQFDYPGADTMYSAALLLGGRTPIGPLTLVLAATSESDWQLSFNLGRPVPENTIMDPVW